MKLSARKLLQFDGHEQPVYALAHNKAENILYSGGGDLRIIAWHLDGNTPPVMIANTPFPVFSLWFDEINYCLWVGTQQGGIHIIDLHQKKEIRFIHHPCEGIFHYEPVGTKVWLSCSDGTVISMDRENYSVDFTRQVHPGKIRKLIYTGKEVLAACADGYVRFLDPSDAHCLKELKAHEWPVNALSFYDGKLVTGSKDAHLKLWDSENIEMPLISIPAHYYAIYGMVAHPLWNILITISRDKTIKAWNRDSLDFLLRIEKPEFDGHKFSVNTIAMDINTGIFYTAGDDRSIKCWEIYPV